MLLAVCVVALLFTLTAWGLLKAALVITARLGVEPMAALVWLGLAERPVGQPRDARGRLGDLLDPRIYRDSAEMP
jgi:hypothetical protein